jgi:hypothetical protein
MTTLTRTKEFAISTTAKTVITVVGLVVLELAVVYGLIPIGIYFWRLLTCPC